jgi:hypothetical protein
VRFDPHRWPVPRAATDRDVTGDAQGQFDPLWGMVDPAAGAWFPAQALQLAQNANPALL